MPTLTVTKTYNDGAVLNESDLDGIKSSLETFFNTTKIDGDNIQTGGVPTAAIANAAVTADKLAAAVAGDGLAGGAGTALSVNVDGSTLEINTDALRIKDLGVSTAKIAANAVTRAKIESVGQQISSSSGSYTTTSTSYVDITNLSVSITTSGRPVMLFLQPASDTSDSYLGCKNTGGSDTGEAGPGNFKIVRDSTDIAMFRISGGLDSDAVNSRSVNIPPGCVLYIDAPAAGTYTYKVQGKVASGKTLEVEQVKLVAYEL